MADRATFFLLAHCYTHCETSLIAIGISYFNVTCRKLFLKKNAFSSFVRRTFPKYVPKPLGNSLLNF